MAGGADATQPGEAAAPREEVRQQLLELLAEQSRSVPGAMAVLMMVVALMVAQRMPAWIPTLWAAATLGMLVLRRRRLGRLAREREIPIEDRLRTAVRLSFANGCVHGLILAVFPVVQDTERLFLTLLLLGLCAGAVGTTAGYRPVFLSYLLPAAGTLPLWWVLYPRGASPQWTDVSLAVLIGLYLWVLVTLSRNAWRNFSESVHMRFQDRAMAVQLRDALAQATQANQAKTRFLAAASHDLRQPLHTIGLLVAALTLRPMDGRDREVVDLLSQVSMALSEQLDQLLDISKLDAGVMATENSAVDLVATLRMLHAEMRAAIERKGLQAILDCPVDARCWTDPALLVRVLRNLVDNAIKFTRQGSITLRLHIENGDAVVSVRDTGAGIAPAEHAMVFEEFYQTDNPERDRAKGLGLGLSIVQRLCRLLGVAVELRSQPQVGTEVLLRMPLLALPLAAPDDTGAPPPARSFAGLSVLVVDDERSVRTGMRVLLEEMGCRVAEAGSVEEARRQALAEAPDVVLADMRLRGGETGMQAIAAVEAVAGTTPALLISGDTAPDRLQEANRARIKLLHKPVGLAVLQAELARVLEEAKS